MLLNDASSKRRLTNRDINFLPFSLTKKNFPTVTFCSVINQSTQNHFLCTDFKILYAELDEDYWPFSFRVLVPCGLWGHCAAVNNKIHSSYAAMT